MRRKRPLAERKRATCTQPTSKSAVGRPGSCLPLSQLSHLAIEGVPHSHSRVTHSHSTVPHRIQQYHIHIQQYHSRIQQYSQKRTRTQLISILAAWTKCCSAPVSASLKQSEQLLQILLRALHSSAVVASESHRLRHLRAVAWQLELLPIPSADLRT